MELGGDTGIPIENTEETRDELIKVAFGIWDHIKNKGDHGFDNWELEWVGFLPGKRESRRYIGDYVLTQRDIESGGNFNDVVAYGGWPMDDHNPRGMLANKPTDAPSYFYPAPSPYGIPYRCLYSKNIDNLLFAGRNISATHAGLSSTRVMATCSLLGQAVGNAVSLCVKHEISPREVYNNHINELQQQILDDGVFLPNVKREISSLTRESSINLSTEEVESLLSGIDRPRTFDLENGVELKVGEELIFTFKESKVINKLRIMFDPDYDRLSLSPNKKMRVFAQKLHQGLDFEPMKVASSLVKDFEVYVDGKLAYSNTNNYNSLVKIELGKMAKEVRVKFNKTWGKDKVRIFACDLI